MRLGCFPGSFDPPTHAHLSIARLAIAQHGLDRLDFVISRTPLAKAAQRQVAVEDRGRLLIDVLADDHRFGVVITDHQLIVDLAAGYDLVVMGADKWAQIHDPAFYDNDPAVRDAAVLRLPRAAVVDRPPHPTPAEFRLDVGSAGTDLHDVSSTAARTDRPEQMVERARASGWW